MSPSLLVILGAAALSLADGLLAGGGDLSGPEVYNESVYTSPTHFRLRRALEDLASGSKNVTFAVAGGSPTAGTGLPRADTWFGQVIGKIREWSGVATNPNQLIAHNAAQGFTNSFWSWMLMDSIIGDADVLFWEYGLNDVQESDHASMAQEIELWIRRASALPSQPALVFVYMYDPQHKGSFRSTALANQRLEIIRLTKALGLDVLLLPVGEIMRDIEKRKGLYSTIDGKNPSRTAHHRIANMVFQEIKHAYFSDASWTLPGPSPDFPSVGQSFAGSSLPSLANLRSASWTVTEPRFGDAQGKVAMCPTGGDQLHQFTKFLSTSVCDTALVLERNVSRDRKIGVQVPRCWSENVHQGLHITLSGESTCNDAKVVALKVGVEGGEFVRGPQQILVEVGHGHYGRTSRELPHSDIGQVAEDLARHFNVILMAMPSDNGKCKAVSICTPWKVESTLTVYAATVFY